MIPPATTSSSNSQRLSLVIGTITQATPKLVFRSDALELVRERLGMLLVDEFTQASGSTLAPLASLILTGVSLILLLGDLNQLPEQCRIEGWEGRLLRQALAHGLLVRDNQSLLASILWNVEAMRYRNAPLLDLANLS